MGAWRKCECLKRGGGIVWKLTINSPALGLKGRSDFINCNRKPHLSAVTGHMTEGFPYMPRSMANPLASAYLTVVNNESDLPVFLCYCMPCCWRMPVILHSMDMHNMSTAPRLVISAKINGSVVNSHYIITIRKPDTPTNVHPFVRLLKTEKGLGWGLICR